MYKASTMAQVCSHNKMAYFGVIIQNNVGKKSLLNGSTSRNYMYQDVDLFK